MSSPVPFEVRRKHVGRTDRLIPTGELDIATLRSSNGRLTPLTTTMMRR